MKARIVISDSSSLTGSPCFLSSAAGHLLLGTRAEVVKTMNGMIQIAASNVLYT